MKRILYFFPENPLEKNAGNKIRALSLLEYFKDRGFTTDFVSMNKWASPWNEDDIKTFGQSGLVQNTWLLNRKPKKNNLFKYLLKYKIPEAFYKVVRKNRGAIADHANYYLRSQFNAILKAEHYDYIIISYAYWSGLVANNSLKRDATTIVDTHDFLTAQHQNDPNFILGATFEDEINRLDTFDEVWAISSDEQFIFSQFCKNKVRLVPVSMSYKTEGSTENRIFDLIYVASNNLHNKTAAKWFFEYVYPRISPDVRICVIGGISNSIGDYINVHKVPFAVDLTPWYAKSKIAICPMFTGTGIKIKLIEALAHGLPVVCTERGVDGLRNKTENGCLVSDDTLQFAGYITELLKNEALYKSQQNLGLHFYRSQFSTPVVYDILDQVFLATNNI